MFKRPSKQKPSKVREALGGWSFCWALIGVTHLSTGLSLLVLLLLETALLEAAEPFQEGLLEFISADFWKTSMVALAMFSSRE